jgi:hypothetical protein
MAIRIARSRVYEQSDALQWRIEEFVVVVAVNEATGAMYRFTTSLTHESRPSTELGLTVLNVFKKKIVLKEFLILCGFFVC